MGSKIALVCDGQLVTYLRDCHASIHDPERWDLLGGEREVSETALACVERETDEEFGIEINESWLTRAASYKSHQPGRADVAFFVGEITKEVIQNIQFDDEGQYWRMMAID